jgi:DNA-binding NtrC family response regulator
VRSIPGFESLVGETQAMLDLRLDILRAARSDNTVLLVGEPGTGKEVIARLIHLHSRRSQIPFLCQHVARELITIDRIAPAFFPAGLKTADVISAEYRDVPGMHGLFPPSRGKQERGRGGDAATRSEEHPAPIQDDPELATALASSEPELPSRLRPLFRILMGRLYQTWQADKFFNFFEFDSGASSSENIAPELFGAPSERFTGVAGGPGRFQTASHCGGTLFLDNIHHLPLTVQRALLKATEITHAERRVARHGAAVQEPVNTRIIVASISDLPQLVSKETFLAELMSRLMVEVIHVPPLRERRQDIPMLGAHFAGLHGKCLTDDAIEPLMASDWRDSNVRGLRCVLENAAGRVAGSHIVRRDIDLAMSALYPGSPLSVTNEEERMIRNALAENDWNVTLAARSIGWNRQKLYRAMEKYGISPDR